MGKPKSLLVVIALLLGGYAVTRVAVAAFFDGAVAAVVGKGEEDAVTASAEPGSTAASQNKAPQTATAARGAASSAPAPDVAPNWQPGSSDKGTGWTADSSWTGTPAASGSNMASPSVGTTPAPSAAPSTPPSAPPLTP